jgi:AcrR family transcriptional regulator
MAETARPLRADAERNRRRLIEAAAELFRTKGISVGLDEIARHAGVGVGTAYRRFPDKEELIDALFDDRVEEIAGYAGEALEHDDPWEGFVQFFEKSARLHATDRSVREVLFGSPDQRERVAGARARIAPLVAQLVQRAQSGGAMRADVSVIDVPIMLFVLGGFTDLETPGQPELWRRYLGILLDGLRTPDPTPLPGRAPTPDEFDRTFGSVRRR